MDNIGNGKRWQKKESDRKAIGEGAGAEEDADDEAKTLEGRDQWIPARQILMAWYSCRGDSSHSPAENLHGPRGTRNMDDEKYLTLIRIHVVIMWWW